MKLVQVRLSATEKQIRDAVRSLQDKAGNYYAKYKTVGNPFEKLPSNNPDIQFYVSVMGSNHCTLPSPNKRKSNDLVFAVHIQNFVKGKSLMTWYSSGSYFNPLMMGTQAQKDFVFSSAYAEIAEFLDNFTESETDF